MSVSAKIRHYTTIQRELFLDLWRNSGISQSEFCRLYGIPYGLLNPPKDKQSPQKLKLLPVISSNTSTPIAPMPSIKLTFPSGVSCQFLGCSDMNSVIQLIKGYEQCN